MKVFLVLLSLSIVGCGWHLRSSSYSGDELESLYVGSLQATYQQGPDSIIHVFEQRMDDLDIVKSNSLGDSQLGIVLLSESRDERVLSLTSDLFEQQTRLSKTVQYQVWRGDEILVQNQSASTFRDLTQDQSKAAAKNRESALIYSEINVDLVNQIIRQAQRHTQSADEN